MLSYYQKKGGKVNAVRIWKLFRVEAGIFYYHIRIHTYTYTTRNFILWIRILRR